ncbi:MAG TPA: CMD domain protein [Thermomicrobiales bacterium]|nr:CMD domain protein [Thermomicrobiales bacterium]
MTIAEPDIINQLAGIIAGSELADLRGTRPETQAFARGSYLALLEPDDPAGVSRLEREAIGLRVATLARSQVVSDFHTARLLALGADEALLAGVVDFPDGFTGSERLAALLRHVDLLTCSSRNGSPAEIANLRAAGLSARDIVTVSQLIAWLSYEIRMIATLHALAGAA